MELPGEPSLRWLVSRYAGLLAQHGAAFESPELVQPNGDYFPDEHRPSADGVARLFTRVLSYTPARDGLDVRFRFLDGAEEARGGCGDAGSCGTCAPKTGGKLNDRVIAGEGSYLIELPVDVVGDPIALTTTLARSAGAVVLFEAGEEPVAAEIGAMSEIAAIASGLGVLVTSGAHVYAKSCGGVHVGRHTHLSVAEAAVGLALFAAVHGVKPKVAKSHLDVTPREAFVEAHDWVESNPAIVAELQQRPEVLEAGLFRCEETKGFFGKLLARRAVREEEEALRIPPARRELV
jgi:hypothetical protein